MPTLMNYEHDRSGKRKKERKGNKTKTRKAIVVHVKKTTTTVTTTVVRVDFNHNVDENFVFAVLYHTYLR